MHRTIEKDGEMRHCLYEATEYNVVARRNLLLGLSVGRALGLDPADLDGFAAEVIAADHEQPGHDDVLAHIAGWMERRGRSAAGRDLTALLVEAQRTARLHFAATD